MAINEPVFREEPVASDPAAVRELLDSTGFFYPFETDVAVELVQERLDKGVASGYHFVFAQVGEKVAGYTCFGPIPCTQGSYDLYWIGVHDDFRGQGLGKELLRRTEAIIAAQGGRAIYVETASREQYLPTREFYKRTRYVVEAVLKEFYGPGDDKVIFVKRLGREVDRD